MYVCILISDLFLPGQLVKCQQSSQSTKKKHQPCCLWQEATVVIWPLGQRPNKKQNQLGSWGSQGYHSTKKPLKFIIGPDLPVRFHGFGGVDKCLPRISQVNYKVRLTDPKKESLGHWSRPFRSFSWQMISAILFWIWLHRLETNMKLHVLKVIHRMIIKQFCSKRPSWTTVTHETHRESNP